MYLKIVYIRLYQELGTDLDADNLMAIGCDPKTHPTKKWIEGHIDEYTDPDNMWKPVAGGAACSQNDDCTIGASGDMAFVNLVTGKCVDKRCECSYTDSWGGPRCMTALSASQTTTGGKFQGFGPPMGAAMGLAAVVVLATMVSIWMTRSSSAVYLHPPQHVAVTKNVAAPSDSGSDVVPLDASGRSVVQHSNMSAEYSKNFV